MTHHVEILEGARPFDMQELARSMRAADAEECRASGGYEPLEALLVSTAKSAECWTAYIGDRVLCMWGVVQYGESIMGRLVGVVWLLTSELIETYGRAFWRACKMELRRLLERWDVLINAIDCRHTKALRWAAKLGFDLEPPAPFGEAGLPFQRFVVTRENLRV
jgi:hypothetical protein